MAWIPSALLAVPVLCAGSSLLVDVSVRKWFTLGGFDLVIYHVGGCDLDGCSRSWE